MQTKQGGDDDKLFGIQAWKTSISRHSGRLVAVTLVAMCTSKPILRPFLITILHVTEHNGSSFTLYKFHGSTGLPVDDEKNVFFQAVVRTTCLHF